MTAPSLRPVSLSTLDTLLPLMAAFYAQFGYPYDPDTQRAIVTNFLTRPEWGVVYLLEEGGQLVGYVALTYGFSFELQGPFGLVDELYVTAPARNRGLGRAVLQALQQQARASGLVALHLQTEPANPRAKRLYESLGFADDGRSNLTWRSTAPPAIPLAAAPQ
jgi:ribosomal protein S18 acetylase RimI-like enzyme